MLAAVVAVFAASDRLLDGAGAAGAAGAALAAAATPTSRFDINIGVTAAVLFAGLGLAGVALAATELMQPRSAKQIPSD